MTTTPPGSILTLKLRFFVITLTLSSATLFLEGFSDTVAFLADEVPVFTAPQGINYGVFVLSVTG